MIHRTRTLSLLVLIILLLAACASPTPEAIPTDAPGGNPPTDEPAPTDVPPTLPPDAPVQPASFAMADVPRASAEGDATELTDGMTRFALDLYRQMSESEDGNMVFSPYSIMAAFAMLQPGARGVTADEIAAVLGFPAQDVLPPAYNALDQSISEAQGEAFELVIANAVWAQPDYPFVEAYLDTLGRYYGAGVNLTDFLVNPEAARQTINGWIAEQTRDRITELLSPGTVTVDTRLVLTNAIYYNADWLQQFDPELTDDRDFTLLDGSTVQVPTMFAPDDHHQVAVGDGWRAIALPYQGNRFAMVVIVPEDFAAYEASLDVAALGEVTAGLSAADWRSVRLTLPKFETDTKLGLADALRALGMSAAFDPAEADFSGIVEDEDLFVSGVIHQANITVDEEGTEAAAATAITMETTSAEIEEPLEFYIDQPFIYAIVDQETGAILFMGRILDPTAG